MMRIGLVAVALFAPMGPARAELVNPPNMAPYALTSSVPTPSSATPGSEVINGGVGSATTLFARGDHTHPRISRAALVSTDASGQWSVTWSTALPNTNYVVLPIPVAAANAAAPNCWIITSTLTTTGVSGKCNVAQNSVLTLSALTAAAGTGITLIPTTSSSAGMSVQVFAIPTTQ